MTLYVTILHDHILLVSFMVEIFSVHDLDQTGWEISDGLAETPPKFQVLQVARQRGERLVEVFPEN